MVYRIQNNSKNIKLFSFQILDFGIYIMSRKLFGDSRDKGSLGDRFRAKRFRLFEYFLEQLDKPVNILDVGGAESFWINRSFHKRQDVHITLLNLEEQEVRSSNMVSVSGDATDLSQYADSAYDIVFSNSVIEHLYTLENQKKMANECMRVGANYFIQTPNKYFLIEPHYRIPFFNFLPRSLAYWILTKTRWSLGQKWKPEDAKVTMDEIRLLSKSEFKSLFSGASLYTEKLFFLRKSFILHNFR